MRLRPVWHQEQSWAPRQDTRQAAARQDPQGGVGAGREVGELGSRRAGAGTQFCGRLASDVQDARWGPLGEGTGEDRTAG